MLNGALLSIPTTCGASTFSIGSQEAEIIANVETTESDEKVKTDNFLILVSFHIFCPPNLFLLSPKFFVSFNV
ncbi:hypothetical protein HYE35_01880 [Mycoplasmopsis bovis]|nr:hypothetical protein [Mycoplasmopsis bovis]QQH21658.1 hypothetical protein HYE35_01880 [Mycoplasmopsis bovis]